MARSLVKVMKQGVEIINAEITIAQQKKILAAWKELEKYGVGFNDEKVSAVSCKSCQAVTDKFALFPGDICLECYKKTPEAWRPITAKELTRMWGGR